MHWQLYGVLAVGMALVVMVDLASGRWARAGLSFLLMAVMGIAAWNRHQDERNARAVDPGAHGANAPRE
jgi:hypothetical protein